MFYSTVLGANRLGQTERVRCQIWPQLIPLLTRYLYDLGAYTTHEPYYLTLLPMYLYDQGSFTTHEPLVPRYICNLDTHAT